ncbi:MAG: 8-oxo-dGTP diphosphatase [Erysipelotrichaceae bacterium]|nr:8-oxo-dGTP diphosphatase [Erysipelotrichaceae bacterium]
MSKVENVELTVLCLVTQGNQILLQNRVKRDWRGYTLPGGHVEKGESIVEAVIREMREETGLTILHPTLCGVKQFPIEEGRYIVFLFKCHEFTGELVSSSEGEMEWIDRARLEEYTTVDDFMELLQVMESDDLNEFIYVIENEEWKVILK